MKNKLRDNIPYKLILDCIPGMPFIYNKDGELIAWGKNVNKILGCSDEELQDKFVTHFIYKDDQEKILNAFQNAFTYGVVDVEYRVVTKQGAVLDFFVSGATAIIEGDEYLLGTALDISEIVSARKKIVELNELLKAEIIYLKDQIEISGIDHQIVGESESLKYTLFRIKQVAPTDASVLIEGETGTGKELVARAVHEKSKRKDKPFVKVNCASIPDNLIESELFGHEKGAFTSAVEKQIGRFEIANGGTIFLDEIGELPINVQPKLLHILQQGEFERIGSSKTIKTDVRVIAATNKKLEDEIKKGKFRSDLYYRLCVFPISVTPLRERKTDIPLLAEHYTKILSEKLNKPIRAISKKSMQQMMNYNWPGNVRELINMIERAIITAQNKILKVEPLTNTKAISDQFIPLEEFEKKYLVDVLQKTHWKIFGEGGAASILKINPDTLRSKIRKLGIKKTMFE